jgi:hypothetical protein
MSNTDDRLPQSFLDRLQSLERSYLAASDPPIAAFAWVEKEAG